MFLILTSLIFYVLLVYTERDPIPEIYTSCQREGHVALTFDQGPSLHTGILLRALTKLGIKASFHVTTDYLTNPVIFAYLKKAASDGHQIGLYVKESAARDERRLKDYLKREGDVVTKHIGKPVKWLRFPSPGPSHEILNLVTKLGYHVTGYNLDSMDYAARSERSEREGSVFRQIKSVLDLIDPPTLGSFICIQSDLVEASVKQTEAIAEYAMKKGYTMVTLDECIFGTSLQPDISSHHDITPDNTQNKKNDKHQHEANNTGEQQQQKNASDKCFEASSIGSVCMLASLLFL